MTTHGRPPIRVLALAESCKPDSASGPLLGYQYVKALLARPDLRVTLVTHDRNRWILGKEPIPGMERIEVDYVDTEYLSIPLMKLAHKLRGKSGLGLSIDSVLFWPTYILFEHVAYRHFAARLRRGEFDLIHRITPFSPTFGSPMAGLTDVPMVIGPLNGGLPWPAEHPDLRRREREWVTRFRKAYRVLPYFRSTYRHAAAVIAGSRYTATEVPRRFRGARFYQPENGIDPERFPIADAWPEPEPGAAFRFVTVGRLVPFKAIDLVVEAMGRSERLRSSTLEIIGDGPMRPELEALVARHGLGDRVSFAGWVDQRELARRLARSQAFVFPSLREFGGGVVLEAMASGLPSVVVDYGGPSELVSPECALRLEMAPREPLIEAVRGAMERLAGDPDLCRSMGRAAAERVRASFTWDRKAADLVAMYEQVLAGRGPAPGRDESRLAATSGLAAS